MVAVIVRLRWRDAAGFAHSREVFPPSIEDRTLYARIRWALHLAWCEDGAVELVRTPP